MADISKFLFLRHLRANPTAHIRHLRKGILAHDGAGQAFWFRPLNAALARFPSTTVNSRSCSTAGPATSRT